MYVHKCAMRYYRFWIYCSNLALLCGTAIFVIAFICVITDQTIILFETITLYEPSFIFSYFALFIQTGVIQVIGCLGAIKLNEKLLNFYLILMIILLFNDGIIGIIWVLRYNNIVTNLRGDLKKKLVSDYGNHKEFKDVMDDIQRMWRCCGIDGPNDYNSSEWSDEWSAKQNDIQYLAQLIPKSCCRNDEPVFPDQHYCSTDQQYGYDPKYIYTYGCYDHIYHWLQKSADLLTILGFCVISFIKLCFLCILRYEIKEMIEKIKLIKGLSNTQTHPIRDLEAYLPRPSVQQDSSETFFTNTPQSNFRVCCASERHHHHIHNHLYKGSSSGINGSNTGNTRITKDNILKKQSIV